MGQKKLVRFEAIKGFPNVLQYPEGMPGKWQEHFGNNHPITLELACGKGEYTVGLSAMYPDRNFIGVDVKGNRLYVGAKQCIAANRRNAAFLRTQIDRIATYFAPGEVEEIWLTFPDPQLRKSRAKKRLTHPKFLRLYQQFLRPGGIINLKTDSPVLYQFTLMVLELYGLELVAQSADVYGQKSVSPELQIKTHYEGLDIAGSNRIHYVAFRLPAQTLQDKDQILQELVKQHEEATD
ncbi:tRNA (guanosine(46)-N7)-methyltransferase TrmB [Flavihumibacter rivuli]|uniref:tRNA (guanosine(46)-N7)-methyltransferase TrmB n=1 Tax=Flavihumibacter rivuli TaxID=2838156 RepID=UPI001BDF567F|nr:tRNA (guanosine(46)-N7)-methyltransferase TrmB [Flavihumibacter rivuli]ULQ55522.1 tRNA (guanosine(46)-N7)-methyltransferase TrmB [Flavihumibacter rivuli]